jgi:hypothetical protein
MKVTSKFKIGDTVGMLDTFHFNPMEDVMSVGKITAIHFYRGKEMFGRPQKDGSYVQKSLKGRIGYHVSGFSLIPDEERLFLVESVRKEKSHDSKSNGA